MHELGRREHLAQVLHAFLGFGEFHFIVFSMYSISLESNFKIS
jgi:hypothetical protein